MRTNIMWQAAILFVALAVLFSPVFFAIYRTMIFDTLPRDDYGSYVLWMSGVRGGVVPVSPYVYRALSVAIASIFYHIIPLIHFSRLPADVSQSYAKATEAIACMSYLSIIGIAVLTYYAALVRFRWPPITAATAAVIAGGLVSNSAYWAIDPPAIFMILVGVLCIERPLRFSALIFGAIFFNEKILIVFGGVLVIRSIFMRGYWKSHIIQTIAALSAIAVYLGALHFLAFKGNSYQLSPDQFISTATTNIHFLFTIKGMYLDDLPYMMLAGLWCCADYIPALPVEFQRADGWMIPYLLLVSLVFTHSFSFGRIVIYASPLFWFSSAPGLVRRMVATR